MVGNLYLTVKSLPAAWFELCATGVLMRMEFSLGLRQLSFTRASASSTCRLLERSRWRTKTEPSGPSSMAKFTITVSFVVISKRVAMCSKGTRIRRSCLIFMKKTVSIS